MTPFITQLPGWREMANAACLSLRKTTTMIIPVSRQLPEYCPRRIVLAEVDDDLGRYWKVTIGGKSALLTYDEMLSVVATEARPKTSYPLYWTCFQSDAEREYEDRIRASYRKLRDMDCLEQSEIVW